MKDEFDEDEATKLVSYVTKSDKWIINSGCSHHMTSDKSKFITLENYNGNNVRFSNDAPYLIKGKGSIRLIDKIMCENAYYVEGVNYNMLSVSQLNSLVYKFEFRNRKAKNYDADGKLIGSGDQTRGNLFFLVMNEENFLIVQFDDVWLWHKRLCHVNLESMISISKMKRVNGFPKLKKPDNVIYKQCQLGKMIESSFKSKTHTSNGILELVHIYLCGPNDVQIYKDDKYFILFVDDYSRMMIAMILRGKFDAFQMFKLYIARVEKETSKILEFLRYDRDGEFTSNEFNNFYNDEGIKRKTSTLRTPPQNGIVERRNRYVMDCGRILMMEKNVDLKY